jgi:hypothetical protein
MDRWSLVGAVFWCASAWVAVGPSRARAEESGGTPSVFTCAMDGLWLGLLVGTGGGYIRARRGGFESDDWRPVVLGGGIGALSGVGVGLTAGFIDLAAERPGRGSIALRDSLYGAGLGALLGAITGALVLVRSDEPEHVGFGAAIGTLSGAGAGLVLGLIEGHVAAKRAARGSEATRLRPNLAWTRDHSGALLPALALSGSF